MSVDFVSFGQNKKKKKEYVALSMEGANRY